MATVSDPPFPAAPPEISPVSAQERILFLDVLRGFAVLGILLMNIQFFSMPTAAYSNPTAFGDLSGINLISFGIAYVFAELKFISLFSLLFGAGIALMLSRAEERGEARPGLLHARRMFWLLVFGLVHAYALWAGDILVTYALCGLIYFPLRKAGPRVLLGVGIALISVGFLMSMLMGWSMQYWPAEAMDDMRKSWAPTAEQLGEEITAYQGNWLEQMPRRATDAFLMQLPLLFLFSLWRVGGMMLVGMALLKNGFLRGEWSDKGYLAMAAGGCGAGLALTSTGLWQHFAHGWAMEYSFFFGAQWNYWGSFLMCLGYAAGVALAVKRGWFRDVQKRLAAAGRMAFSNYILETLICTTIFYGHGLGLFAEAERWVQTVVVLGVWAVILVVSPWWLSRNAYGPLEYLWRRLTYGQMRVRGTIPEPVSPA